MPKANLPKASETLEVATEKQVAPQVAPKPEAKDKPKSNTYQSKNGDVTFTVTDY